MHRIPLCLAGSCVALAAMAGAAPPIAVSPGGVERVERSASRCPTFSWGATDPVEVWHLAVYRLATEATADAEAAWEPALSKRLPGAVTTWTPSLDECLDASETYAWFVGTPEGTWSEGRLFDVAEPPALELERVITALRGRLNDDEARELARALLPRDQTSGEASRAAAPRPPVPTRAVSPVVSAGFGVDAQGIAWGNAFILRCGTGAAASYYRDLDEDGFGRTSDFALACLQPTGYVVNGGDCDDTNEVVNPIGLEICGDGIDNNCDGSSTEGGEACVTEQPGVCSQGITACAGNAVVCNQLVEPSAEICNGLDDNCDGEPDEDLTQQCYEGPPGTQGIGICQPGSQACVGGAYGSCVGQVLPTTEVCANGMDDDCDGVEDEPECDAG